MPGGDRADEPDGRACRGSRRSRRRRPAGTGHQVEHPRREVGLRDALGHADRADAGGGRGRQHHGVAVRERRRDDLGRHRVRPVPRADDRHDPERHAVQEDALAGVDRRRDDPSASGSRRPRPCRSRRSAPRPRPEPRPRAACPGRARACARGRPGGRRSPRRRASSPPPGRTPTAPPSRARPGRPPRSHARRRRGCPRGPSRSPRRSTGWSPRTSRRPRRPPTRRRSTSAVLAHDLTVGGGPRPPRVVLERLDQAGISAWWMSVDVDPLAPAHLLGDQVDGQREQVHAAHEPQRRGVVDRVQLVGQPLVEVVAEEQGRDRRRDREQRDAGDLVAGDGRVRVQLASCATAG